MRIRNILATGALATVAVVSLGSAANASVSVTDGAGWVGKGDVQTVLHLNNAALQKAVNDGRIKFTTTQDASQALSQSTTQAVTQSATQDVTRVVSCTIEGKKQTHVAYGERDGSRTGIREGVRAGSRQGSLKGALVADVLADPRKTGQWTGWNLKGFAQGSPVFEAGAEVWSDETALGDVQFGADVFGDVVWRGWESTPGANPADCLRNDNQDVVLDLFDETTANDVEYGAEQSGEVVYGEVVHGAVTATGPSVLFVNGQALPNTPVL